MLTSCEGGGTPPLDPTSPASPFFLGGSGKPRPRRFLPDPCLGAGNGHFALDASQTPDSSTQEPARAAGDRARARAGFQHGLMLDPVPTKLDVRVTPMHITMVKKQLLSGQPCRKCAQAEEMLRQRGYWDLIDEVVYAVEGDTNSPGMRLSEQYGIDIAPFFIVKTDTGQSRAYKSVLMLMKEHLAPLGGPPAVVRRPGASESDLAEAAESLASAAPQEILSWGLSRFGRECALSFSGAEDVVLIDMASKLGLPFSVFSLDTGRLHPQTYRFIEKVRTHYALEIELFSPEAEALQAFVRTKGLFSFYEDGHKECCGIRKVEPLRRALSQRSAWVTGQRKDQSVTRIDLPVIQSDPVFSGKERELVKLNPLANWSSGQVWQYIRENEVPYNELHGEGYVSIGCEPCTRPIRPGEHERAGRWSWEAETQRECGLHVAK